jgi:hypothetical protein
VDKERLEAMAARKRQAEMVDELRKAELVRDRLESLQQLVDSPRLLAATRGSSDAAIDGHVAQLKPDEAIVNSEYHLSEGVHRSGFDPLVAPTPERGSRILLVGYPPVGAAEHQHLDQLLEDHPIWYPTTVTAKRMVCLSLWQQGGELFPNRFDDVWLDGGHGVCSFTLGSLDNSPDDRVLRARLLRRHAALLLAQPLSLGQLTG